MSDVAEFNRLLGQRIKEMLPVQTVWAVCKSVDWDAFTMTATGQSDSLDYEEVLLGRGSVMKKPVVGTLVLIGIIENNGANTFLIDAENVEEYLIEDESGFKVVLNANGMTLNGNQFGGIVKADELKTQVDKNTAIIQAIQQALQSWTPVPEDGGAALKALTGAIPSMQRANLGSIKNDKIKHG